MNAATTGAVILGGGYSRRFGDADKRLATLSNNLTVAATTVATYCEAFAACRVVLRTDDEALAEILDPYPVKLVFTDEAASGMGHSLAAGVRGLDWDWTFIALLDMPYVCAATLGQLREATATAGDAWIVRPRYRPAPETPAHPIGFHRALLPELKTSRGDAGARHVLEAHRDQICWVDCDDIGIIRDIDAPEDLN